MASRLNTKETENQHDNNVVRQEFKTCKSYCVCKAFKERK